MITNTQPSRTWPQCDILRSRVTNQHFEDYAGGDSVKWLIMKLHHEQLLSAVLGNLKLRFLEEKWASWGCCRHLSPVLHSSDTTYFTNYTSK